MKTPRFKPVYFENRAYSWGITIPPYLSPSGRITRRFFLTLREAKEFGAHMRRRYDDHEHDSTYLARDRLAEAAKAYDLIAAVGRETGRDGHTLAGIVEAWAASARQAARSVSLDQLFDEYIAAREASSTDIYLSDLRRCKQRLNLGWRIASQITAGDLEGVIHRRGYRAQYSAIWA